MRQFQLDEEAGRETDSLEYSREFRNFWKAETDAAYERGKRAALRKEPVQRHNHITRDIKPYGQCPACDATRDGCQRCGHSLEDHHPDCQPCPKCKLDYSLCRGAASGVCNQEFLRVESAAQASWEALNGAGSWQQTTQGQRDRYYRQISVAIDEADRLRGEQK